MLMSDPIAIITALAVRLGAAPNVNQTLRLMVQIPNTRMRQPRMALSLFPVRVFLIRVTKCF